MLAQELILNVSVCVDPEIILAHPVIVTDAAIKLAVINFFIKIPPQNKGGTLQYKNDYSISL